MSANLTRTEVCELLGVSPKSLYLWERHGRIPAPRRDRRNWRLYSPKDVETIRRVLGQGHGEKAEASQDRSRTGTFRAEGLSARNQLRGVIVGLRKSGLICEVVLRLGDGQEITSIITSASAGRLGLRKGREASAIVKATEVMILR